MRGVLKQVAMGAVVLLLANAACFAACALKPCGTVATAKSHVPPCHKHKPGPKSADSPCFERTLIAPLPADAAIDLEPAEAGPAIEPPVLEAIVFELPSRAADAPDPPDDTLVLRI
jgi:hypothetical protein